MKKKDIMRLVNNPNFIPGVYNYCDRWCERCPLTARCANYAIGEEQFSKPEDRDIENSRFWEKLHEVFQVTLEMIQEMAEEQGIDLSDIDQEESRERESQLRQAAGDHPCTKSAKKYYTMVNAWFDSSEELLKQKGEELNLQNRLELPGADPAGSFAELSDAIEVIRWYQYQVYVKLMRAVGGAMEEQHEMIRDFPKDSDGSAKVALIGIDRSIAAWGSILRFFPEDEDRLLKFLVQLEKLRRNAEETFPEARSFVRQGFDDL